MANTSSISSDRNFKWLDQIITVATATGLRAGSTDMLRDLVFSLNDANKAHTEFVDAAMLAGIADDNATSATELGRLRAGSILKIAAPSGALHAVAFGELPTAPTRHSKAKQTALNLIGRQVALADKSLRNCVRDATYGPFYNEPGGLSPGISAHAWVENQCNDRLQDLLCAVTKYVRLDAGGDTPA